MQLAGILLELGFEPLEQREGVGGRAGEAGDHVALAEPAHLLGVVLDDGLADRHLAVAGDHDLAALADGQDRRAVPIRDFVTYATSPARIVIYARSRAICK